MKRTSDQLRRDAVRIWQAGLSAVRSDRLVREAVRPHGGQLIVGDETVELAGVRRIVVVGAGKAGAGMAEGVEQALGERLTAEKALSGWVNVPDDCARPLAHIHLHRARPAGVNEPTPAGVEGAREILRIVSNLTADDLCIALISGGGSALLPLPIDGITLADKLDVTRFLSAAGAPIEDLNLVRKHLSGIKGGKLARACRARRMIVLVISDVLGDRLDTIASGPTVADETSPTEAIAILERYGARDGSISPRVFEALARQQSPPPPSACPVSHHVIGNNAVAVDAAGLEAERLGYSHAMVSANASEGPAEEVAEHLATMVLAMRTGPGPDCLISGGEPTVKLVSATERGLGGRNQQLVLAAAERLQADAAGILLLSGGTDGEDGPTNAAGAFVDAPMLAEARRRGLSARDHLARNDAYRWFEPLGGLVITGPTNTNVCDVRVVLVDRRELPHC